MTLQAEFTKDEMSELLKEQPLWKQVLLTLDDADMLDELLKLHDESNRSDMKLLATWIKDSPKMEEFMNKWGVEEALYIIVIMNLGPILTGDTEVTEELMDSMDYPIDDLGFVHMLYWMVKINAEKGTSTEVRAWLCNFMKILERGADMDLLRRALELVDKWIRVGGIKVDKTMLIKEWDSEERINYDSEMRHKFNSAFGDNHLLTVGSADTNDVFYDDNSGKFFSLHSSSLVGRQNAASHRAHYSIYGKLKEDDQVGRYADFIVHVPKLSKVALRSTFHGLGNVELSAGYLLVKNLSIWVKSQKPSDNFGTMPAKDAFHIRSYDKARCILSVICDKRKEPAIRGVLFKVMGQIAKRARINARRVHLGSFAVTAIVGPGLQIQGLELGKEEEPIMITFKPDRSAEMNLDELCDRISSLSVKANYSVVKKKGEVLALIVRFSDPVYCNKVMRNALAWPYECEAKASKKVINWGLGVHSCANSPICRSLARGDADTVPATECCICLSQCEEWIHLSLCGHAYCFECAAGLVEYSSSFPIECCHEGCDAIFLFADIDAIAGHVGEAESEKLLKNTVTKSLRVFLGECSLVSQNGFKECASCNHILKCSISPIKKNGGATLCQEVHCAGCDATRCAACGFESHCGYTCQESHAQRLYGDKALMEWRRGDSINRAFCPNKNCHALIEKSGGCNHVQCRKCYQDFCWLCKYKAKLSREIYAHLDKEHGGNGLPIDYIPPEEMDMDDDDEFAGILFE